MAVPMTASAPTDFGRRKYHIIVLFNFLLSFAAPHLLGVIVFDTRLATLQIKYISDNLFAYIKGSAFMPLTYSRYRFIQKKQQYFISQ